MTKVYPYPLQETRLQMIKYNKSREARTENEKKKRIRHQRKNVSHPSYSPNSNPPSRRGNQHEN